MLEKIKNKIHYKLIVFLEKYTNYNSLTIILVLSKQPQLYYLYFSSIDPRFPELAIRRNTQLVIEGFPRSANTFAVVAFQYAQPVKVRIAHHLHIPAQVIRAKRWGIPAIVLIRKPKQAIASLIVRNPTLKINQAFRWYISFYETLSQYKSAYILATFEQVIEDYSIVIQRVNEKFGTSFIPFTPTGLDLKSIFAKINTIEPTLKKQCTPSSKKDEIKNLIIQDFENHDHCFLLKKAENLYQEIIKMS